MLLPTHRFPTRPVFPPPHGQVEAVTLGDQGVLAGLKPGGLVIDMTTSTPSLAVQIAAWAAAQGCISIDAPVSGGDVGAEAATLSIMCGDVSRFNSGKAKGRMSVRTIYLIGG